MQLSLKPRTKENSRFVVIVVLLISLHRLSWHARTGLYITFYCFSFSLALFNLLIGNTAVRSAREKKRIHSGSK
jgi:hypothetical protein